LDRAHVYRRLEPDAIGAVMTWSWRSNSSSKRIGRSRLAAGLVRITKKGRRLNADERVVHEQRLRRDGILPPTQLKKGDPNNALGT
jgi:hypothetical protein